MPSTSLITSRSCTFHLFLFLFSFLQLFSWTKTTPTMDHPLMHSRRSSSSVFMKVVKEDQEEEDYDDLAEGEEEEEEKEDEEGGELEVEECYQKKKRMKLGGGSTGKKGSTTAGCSRGGVALVPLPVGCQVDNCDANLADSKRYHQRHKVCEYHAKAQVVMTAGQRQRFCQQCSRFHELSEFDNAKRSCRTRLAGHNERRRKHFSESRGGSATRIKKNQCRQVDEKGRTQMAAFA